MGRITLYSELSLSSYVNAEFLRKRVACCIDTTIPPVMVKVDWFLWAYNLFELSLKKLAVFYKLKMNSKLHNSSAIFYSLFVACKYGEGLRRHLEEDMTSRGYFDMDSVLDSLHYMISLNFVSLRYTFDYIETIENLDLKLLRIFLNCISTLVLELETGKISIELEVT